MDRSLRLAALASAAVPGLDPMAVQEVVSGDHEHFDVAFIQDTQQRRWVIRAPRDEVSAAHMDASLAMLALLHRRVPFAVPAAKGFAPVAGVGRAAVHAYIPGHPLDYSALRPGHPVTAELGRTIALIHNVDRALFDEAGLPSYDAEAYRRRHLAEIDRGAATGRVPAGLLARWEEALDDVRLWRFAPTPVHGALTGSDVLVSFPDPTDPSRATIRGVTGWEDAKVADPADDLAALVATTAPEVVAAVLRAYAHVRVERPDEHLLSRARLVGELTLLATLLRAVAARDEVVTEATTARLRRLDDSVHHEASAGRLRIVPAPAPAPSTAARTSADEPATGSRPQPEPLAAPAGDAQADRAPSVDDDATDVIDAVEIDAVETDRVETDPLETSAMDTGAVDTDAVDDDAVDDDAVDDDAVDDDAVDTGAVDTDAVDTDAVDTDAVETKLDETRPEENGQRENGRDDNGPSEDAEPASR